MSTCLLCTILGLEVHICSRLTYILYVSVYFTKHCVVSVLQSCLRVGSRSSGRECIGIGSKRRTLGHSSSMCTFLFVHVSSYSNFSFFLRIFILLQSGWQNWRRLLKRTVLEVILTIECTSQLSQLPVETSTSYLKVFLSRPSRSQMNLPQECMPTFIELWTTSTRFEVHCYCYFKGLWYSLFDV